MLRIGEVAELAGVSTRAIRHYHQIGLLPEPARMANGYRGYELPDVVVVLRVRRLVELGMRLDEIAGVLTADRGRELRDILAELDADLAEQQRRIRMRRQRIAELLAKEDASTFSTELAVMLSDLERTAGGEPSAGREYLVAQMFNVMSAELTAPTTEAHRTAPTDRDLATQLTELAASFRRLAGRPPTDPAVTDVARRAARLSPAVLAHLPNRLQPTQATDPGGPSQSGDPAQTRCAQLLLEYLRDQA
jgi:DNA-binding transcriptional MerR regulator